MASSSSQTAVSAASNSPPAASYSTPASTEWEVFLSFHGENTRNTFTSHLYAALVHHGIRTFMDDPGHELDSSEVISDAIRESKSYVIVFSENYASSHWCLDELVEILNCHQTIGRLVVPVFYNIDPSVVQHQIESFNNALQKHEMEKLVNWPVTLTKDGKVSGYQVCKNISEFDIINQIVEKVLLEIQPLTLDVAKYLVGLDSRVKDITALMNSGKDIVAIGICGMGGIGKTTLAKAVYNKNYQYFQGSCFLENVKEASGTKRGLVHLQQQLINDVLKFKNINIDNVDQGIELIRARLSSRKVLVVFDDLDNPEPLEFLQGPFAMGSKIIITTRNEDLLDLIKVEARYKVTELGDADSRQLFLQHAFLGDDDISNTLMELSEEIIEHAGGLPLAIKVFASRLLKESEEEWRLFLKTLKRVPLEDIEKKLVISFDVLKLVDPMLQNIFLDIACFFIGWKKEEVVKILETYYTFVNLYIDILKKRSLLTVNIKDELGMHGLLRDMGRKIAHNNFPRNPRRHTRLWLSDDICNVLKKYKGTKLIEGIIPHNLYYQDALDGVSIATTTFRRMSKLRFLYLEDVNLSGSFKKTFEDLRWLCWKFCPLEFLPSDFYPQNLVTLWLPHSKMRTIWELNRVPKVFAKLKTLNMSYSLALTETPDFTNLPSLETINLEYCESLVDIHVSIGCLVKLISINLSGCANLGHLPDTICNLKALRSLNIGGCSSLEALPLDLGNIESLEVLNAWGLTVSKLPDSIRRLSKSVELNLSDNDYHRTPSTSARWDVFLSYRHEESRFARQLYSALDRHGVRTFMDDTELRNGEVISDTLLLQAMQKSKAYIVVISQKYASSSQCLDELVEIFNSHNTMQGQIIPLFYNIDPSVVLHQTGSFNEIFENHETLFAGELERVNKWRLALTEVASFPGYHISGNRSEDDFFNGIVDKILLKINPKALDVAKYPVGLDSRVKAITTLLNSDTEGVIRIGIYGKGGVGKTTLAKALYNQLLLASFKGSCFLANVREVQGKTKGLVTLQQQLIDDVLQCKKKVKILNVEQGTRLIRERICSAKVLIVIDDIDHLQQYESLVGPFASGSVVIITTRDEEILDKIEVQPKYRCRVKKLNDAQSSRLFNLHAFGYSKPKNTYLLVLAKEIIGLAGGLPLVLEVFGSFLSTQSEEGWKAYTQRLLQTPKITIQQKLMISFEALVADDPILMKIFLDIACFFIGREKKDVVRIMETCYPSVDHNIDVLKKRCLITINSKNKLRMHDLLRDMGRGVVRNHCPNELGKQSRLWVSKDICEVLNMHQGTKAIEGIVPIQHGLEGVSFSTEAFKGMTKLRFLYLKKVNLTGNFAQKFEDLRWLCWDGCPLKCLPSEFYPQKVVILALPNSKMRKLWGLNMVLEKLKTLNMEHSLDLTATPDFTNFPCLETLNLKYCESLEEVHTSIGSLKRLVSLNLKGCMNLRSLPDSICNLRALKLLNVSGCSSLKALPTDLGNIESLTEINARRLNVLKLPDSIGLLSKLAELSINMIKKLESLPNTICNLKAVEFLDFSFCSSLKALPSNISQLSNLGHLNLSDCRLLLSIVELPPTLIVLRVFGCTSVERLPNLSNLKHLETLDLTYCLGLAEIHGLEKLTSLRELHLRGCTSTLLANTLTKHLFQIYSGFRQQINIYAPSAEFPEWIRQTPYWNSQSPDLPPNVSSEFMGMIICFKHLGEFYRIDYSVKTATNDFIVSDSLYTPVNYESLMVIVPRSIFSVTDGDSRIELTADDEIFLGMHLLLENEFTVTDDEISFHPSKRLKHSGSHDYKLRRSERSHKPNPRYMD